MKTTSQPRRVALLHGAGYVGGALIERISLHPFLVLSGVTSSALAGKPVSAAHPSLTSVLDQTFVSDASSALDDSDIVISCAGHGQSASETRDILDAGFSGLFVDMSADYRLKDPELYPIWYGFEHPAPELLDTFAYGLTELNRDELVDARRVANPGCFATGLALAIAPIADLVGAATIHVTAMTGATGSGVLPSRATHFPTRDGNVRAYKALKHQHTAEIFQVLSHKVDLAFVPVSGPWSRGIWGCLQVGLDDGTGPEAASRYHEWFDQSPLIRLWDNTLPELRYSVDTPFCDIGWISRDNHLVVAFALDNLLKGAASQAIQNINLALGLNPLAGLLPGSAVPSIEHAG